MTVAKIEIQKNLLSGKIIFEKVTPDEVTAYAKELLEGPQGDKFSNVHVRRSSSSSKQYGLCFMFKRDKNITADDALWNIKDHAFKTFGAKCVGWDVGHTTWLIHPTRIKA